MSNDNKIPGSDIDDDFGDLPDFGDDFFDSLESGGKRKPVESIKSGLASGFGSSINNRSNQRRLISNALPEGYGKAFDEADTVIASGKALYDSASKNLAPAKNSAKKLARKSIDSADKFIPKKISDKLKKWTEIEVQSNAPTKEQMREEELGGKLADIFGAQVEQNAQSEARHEGERLVDDVKTEIRHKESTSLLQVIRSGMDRQVAFQDKIVSKVYRKQIELQYRQLWVSQDQLRLWMGHSTMTKEALSSIVKNTALPDFLKSQKSELAKAALTQRVLGSGITKASEFGRNITEEFQQNLATRMDGFFKNISDGIIAAQDTAEMTEGMEIDKLEAGASTAADLAVTLGIDPLGKRLGKRFGKNDKVKRLGEDLSYYSDNKFELIRDKLRSYEAAEGGEVDENGNVIPASLTDRLKAFGSTQLLSMMPGFSPNMSFNDRNVTTLTQETAPYTELTDRTITEIIPGLLSEILHETEMLRTGDDSVERQTYSFSTGQFERESDAIEHIRNNVAEKDVYERLSSSLDKIIDDVDRNQTLSDKAREVFKRQLAKDAMSNLGFNPERLVTSSFQDGSKPADEKHVNEIKRFLSTEFFNVSEYKEGVSTFNPENKSSVSQLRSNANKRLGTDVRDVLPNYKEDIGGLRGMYGSDLLQKAGIISNDGRGKDDLNLNHMLDRIVDPSNGTKRKGSNDRPAYDPEVLHSLVMEVGEYAKVERAENPEQQPELQLNNVVKAIESIDPKSNINVTNDWLTKIYDLMLSGFNGPSGGGPNSPKSGPRSNMFTGVGSSLKQHRNTVADKSKDLFKSMKQTGRAGYDRAHAMYGDAINSSYVMMGKDKLSEFQSTAMGYKPQLDGYVSMGSDKLSELQRTVKGYRPTLDGYSAMGKDKLSELQLNAMGYKPQFDLYASMGKNKLSDFRTGVAGYDYGSDLSNLGELKDNSIESLKASLDNIKNKTAPITNIEEARRRAEEKALEAKLWMSELELPKVSGGDYLSDLRAMAGDAGDRGKAGLSSIRSKASGLGRSGVDSVRSFRDRWGSSQQDDTSVPHTVAMKEGDENFWDEARILIEEMKDHIDGQTQSITSAIYETASGQGGSSKPGFMSRLKGFGGKGVRKIGGGLVSTYTGYLSAVGSMVRGGGKGIGSILSGAGGLIGSKLRGKNAKEEPEDVYVKGESEPVLTKRGFSLGAYYDKVSGKVIRTWADVRGAIVNRSGQVLVSKEEIDNDELTTSQGKPVKSMMKGFLSGYAKFATAPTRMMFGLVGKSVSLLTKPKNKARDIYVSGESSPRLTGRLLKKGYYRSAKTGEPIKTIKDIDGDIVDPEGEIVLLASEIEEGLTYRNGEKVSLTGKLAAGGLKMLGSYYSAVGGLAKASLKGIAGLFSRKKGSKMSGNTDPILAHLEAHSTLLKDIYALLDKRMDKSMRGDSDGDGLRDNGWRAQLRKKKSKDAEEDGKNAKGKFADPSKGILGGLAGMLGGLFGMGGNGDGLDAGDALAAGGLGMDLLDRRKGGAKPKAPKPKGKFGKLLNFAKQGGKKALGLGKRLAPMALAALPVMGSAASAVGGAVAAGATAIGGVLSAPVLLSGAAVAAVGLGGYLLYRKFSKPKNDMHSLRIVQYGFNPKDKNSVKRLSALEEALSEYVQISGDEATIARGVDMNSVMNGFGVDTSDQSQVTTFMNWFGLRFKPIYLTHMLAIHSLTKSVDLSKYDSLSAADKSAFLAIVHPKSDPRHYEFMSSPVEGVEGPLTSYQDAMEAAEGLKEKLDKDTKKEAKKLAKKEKTGFFGGLFGRNKKEETKETEDTTSSNNGNPSTAPKASTIATAAVAGSAAAMGDQAVISEGSKQAVSIAEKKQQRALGQAQTQLVSINEKMSNQMGQVVDVLQESYKTQQSMNLSLKEINGFFTELRERNQDMEKEARQNKNLPRHTWTGNALPNSGEPDGPVVDTSR